jgi:hypothetical protein
MGGQIGLDCRDRFGPGNAGSVRQCLRSSRNMTIWPVYDGPEMTPSPPSLIALVVL